MVIEGKQIAAENPTISNHGDPVRGEGDARTGKFNYALRGGGNVNSFDMKRVILIEFTRMPLIHVNAEAEWQ